jgi:hypothetical protein
MLTSVGGKTLSKTIRKLERSAPVIRRMTIMMTIYHGTAS